VSRHRLADLSAAWFEGRYPRADSPEDAPDHWLVELRTVVDTEGVEWILAGDEGDEVLIAPDDADRYAWGWQSPHESHWPTVGNATTVPGVVGDVTTTSPGPGGAAP